jgi:trigger factor
MSDTATTERPNKVTIADAGPSRKKLTIEIPAETVSEKLRDSLDTLATEAQIPGFRKGRAPRGLVEKRFGSALKDETKKQLVADAYTKAVEEHKLQVVGEPVADMYDKIEVESGKALTFDIEVEVVPEFELPGLDGIEVKKPTLEVSDAMVEDELKKIEINEGRLETLEAPEPGDYLTGHGIMTGAEKDGKPEEFYNINGAVVQVPTPDKNGEGMILGIKVADFEKQLGRPKAGDKVTIKAKGPESHEMEGVRNADLTISFEVQRVDRIVPASREEIVNRYGYPSAEELKVTIHQRLQQRAQVQQQVAMRQQVAQYLHENVEMELPERLTASQAARALQRQRLELMYRGVDAHQVEEKIAEMREASAEHARRELKLMFILHKAAEQMDIGVTEAEINGRIAQIAFERQMRPEALRQELIQRNQIGSVFQQIREHKTLDAIVAKATISEVTADEFNAWAKEQAGKTDAPAKKGGKKKSEKPEAKAEEGEKAEAKTEKREAKDEGEKPKPKKGGKKKS